MVALYTRVHHETLVNISDEYMGSQWAVFMPTLDVEAMEPLATLQIQAIA